MFNQETVDSIKSLIKEHISYPDDDFFIDEQDREDYEWMPREDLKDIVRAMHQQIWGIGETALVESLEEYRNRK